MTPPNPLTTPPRTSRPGVLGCGRRGSPPVWSLSLTTPLLHLLTTPLNHPSPPQDIKASGNWMWAAKLPGEGALLWEACEQLTRCMSEVGVAIDGGKDSLSMAARVGSETVKAPGLLLDFSFYNTPYRCYCIVLYNVHSNEWICIRDCVVYISVLSIFLCIVLVENSIVCNKA